MWIQDPFCICNRAPVKLISPALVFLLRFLLSIIHHSPQIDLFLHLSEWKWLTVTSTFCSWQHVRDIAHHWRSSKECAIQNQYWAWHLTGIGLSGRKIKQEFHMLWYPFLTISTGIYNICKARLIVSSSGRTLHQRLKRFTILNISVFVL